MNAMRRVLETITIDEMQSMCKMTPESRNWSYERWLKQIRQARHDDVDGWIDSARRAQEAARQAANKRLYLVKLTRPQPSTKEQSSTDTTENSWLESRIILYVCFVILSASLFIGAASEIVRRLAN